MPWTVKDVGRHTKAAKTARQKRQWVRVANSALASCLNKGGSTKRCEASAVRQANGVVSAARNERIAMNDTLFFANAEITGEGREEVLHGSVYLVRPIKIVRSMVLNGLGDGPRGQWLPEDELQRCPVAAWNNVPLTLGHPFQLNEGATQYCSANSPAMAQKFQVGRIFNAHRDDQQRIAGEAWLDVDTVEMLGTPGEKLVSLFRGNATAEVSSAYHFRLDPTPGDLNGTAYNAIQRDIHPDHVAILLDSAGACSNADGCGLGVNTMGLMESFFQRFFGQHKPCACQGQSQNATFSDVGMAVSTAINDRFGHEAWVQDIEDNPRRVVFRNQGNLVALPFDVDERGRVSLSAGEPVIVQQSTSFITANKEGSMDPITSLDALYACPDIDETVKTQVRESMAFHQAETKKQAEAKEARIVELAANKACDFTLDELKTMSDAMLDKVEKMVKEPVRKTSFVGNGRPESLLAGNEDEDAWVSPASVSQN